MTRKATAAFLELAVETVLAVTLNKCAEVELALPRELALLLNIISLPEPNVTKRSPWIQN